MTSLSSRPSSYWSIAIKTVGSLTNKQDASPFSFSSMGGLKSPEGDDDDPASNRNGESSTFLLTVHPDDPLSTIGRQIHKLTGLEPTRQRLIYRGRILTVESDDDDHELENDKEGRANAHDSEEPCDWRDGFSVGRSGKRVMAEIVDDAGSEAKDPGAALHGENDTQERLNDVADSAFPFARRDSQNSEEVDESVATRSDTMDLTEYASLLRGEGSHCEGGGGTVTQPAALSTFAFASPSATAGAEDRNTCRGNGDDCGAKTGHSKTLKKQRQRIRDVSGLCDGHTIHLVPRPETAASTARSTAANADSGSATNHARTALLTETSPFSGLLGGSGSSNITSTEGGTNVTSISGPEGMHLLAALLGISSSGGEDEIGTGIGGGASGWLTGFEDATATGIGTATTAAASTNTLRAATQRDTETSFSRLANLSSNRRLLRRGGNGSSSARTRAAAARLTEADIRARDPGSLEPVRQGLMTLHTLLGNALLNRPEDAKQESNRGVSSNTDEIGEDEEEKMNSILEEEDQVLYPFPRPRPVSSAISTSQLQSHRQWYRGQWLDALDTVNQWLEATIVDIVLPSDILSTCTFNESTGTHISPFPASRVKKRTRRRTPDAVVSANDLEGRRRLLLEPLPENEIIEEGSLALSDGMYNILDEGYRQRDDNDGVQLLLIHYNGWPHRWDEWIRSDSERIRPFRTRTRHRTTSQLASPTPQNVFQAAPATHIMDEDDEVERASLLPELHRVLSSVNDVLALSIPPQARHAPEDLSPFAPSTDTAHLPWRLPNHGNESIFSSPSNHSSDLASSGRGTNTHSQLDSAQLRRLAPLIDRLGRMLTDAAPHIAALADSLPQPVVEATPAPANTFNLLEEVPGQSPAARVRAMSEWAMNIRSGGNSFNSNRGDTVDERSDDPDLSDFINGMVNTTRGVNRNDRDSNRDPIVSGLLSSYLSSQTGLGLGAAPDAGNDADNALGRLIRMGGGNTGGGGVATGGPGIDIHIHAVVTGPGMNSIGSLGGLGMGTAATPVLSILRNGSSSTNATSTNRGSITQVAGDQAGNEDDTDLFSELYSESPTPLNMHGPTATTSEDETVCHDLNEVFDECRGSDEESCIGNELDVSNSDSNAHTPTVDEESSDSSTNDPIACEGKSSTETPPLANHDEPNNYQSTSHTITSSSSNNSITHNSNGSIHTISEIDSTSSSPSSTPSHRENVTSPSFTNRLYRRTFGRLSGSNSRNPNGSSP